MLRPDPTAPRCFVASRARAALTARGWAIPAAVLVLFPVTAARADTVVAGGTFETVANAAAIGANLDFTQGDGTAGTLTVTGGGIYTGSWTMNNAIGVFNMNGGSFTIAPGVGTTNTAAGTCAIGVTNGSLTLGSNSFLVGFTGTLDVQSTGSLAIIDERWLQNATAIQLAGNYVLPGDPASLLYASTADVAYGGSLALSGGNTSAILTSGAGAGNLTLSGAVSGTGNLLIGKEGGSTATVTLALTGGFTGRTIIDGATAAINTQASIGSQGLTMQTATVTSSTNLLIGGAQTFSLNGTNSFTGSGGVASTLTVNGEMQGNGSLALSNTALVVGGATSTYTGTVSLQGGSTVSTGNAAWVGQLGGLTMNADGLVTSFAYTGSAAATFAGTLTLGEGNNGISLNGAGATGNLTLGGTVAQAPGTVGNLVITSNAGATGTINLAFTGGGFDGRTVIDGAKVGIGTAASIGALGLDLNDGADVTLNTDLTLGAGQQLRLDGLTNVTAGTGTSLTVDGDMQGSGTLQLANIDLTVGAGATGVFTGGLILRDTSTVTSANNTWLAAITTLSFGGDGTATSFEYSGATNVNSLADINVGSGTATLKATGNGGLALNGAVSGSGNLALTNGGTGTGAFTLALTGGFTGRTIIDGATAAINTQASIGSQGLTLQSATVTTGTNLLIGGAQTLVVDGATSFTGSGLAASTLTVNGRMEGAGSLTLSNTALVVGGTTSLFTGAVTLSGGSTISTGNAQWVGQLGGLTMNVGVPVTSFGYTGSDDATFAGSLVLGDGDNGISLNGAGATGDLTLSGAVSQAPGAIAHLVITSNAGATGTINLAFTGGGFDGRTVINGAKVGIGTAASIGALGLDLKDGADVTLNTDLTLGAAQQLLLAGDVNLAGGSSSSLTVDGDMQGSGTLRLRNIDMTVGAGATGTFSGGLILRDTSTVVSANDAWLAALTAFAFGGDGTATSLMYSGAANVSQSATVDVLSGTATIKATGAGSLSLSGEVSGSGTLVLDNVDLSVAAGTGATFTGGLQLKGGSSATVASAAWIGGLDALGMNADGAATSLEYSGAINLNATTAADVTVGAGTAAVTLTGAGNLAFTGAVAGTGDIKLSDGGVGTGTFNLGFTSGSFSGRTIVDGIDGTISTAASFGTAGLTVGGGAEVTLGANAALTGTADLMIDGTATLTGSAASRTLGAAGGLNSTGAGSDLTLGQVALTVGDGAASTFDGSITLTDGASLILDGADLSNAAVAGSAGAAAGSLTISGVGTLASIGVARDFNGLLSVGDHGDSPSSVLNVSGAVNLAAGATLRSYLIDDTGVADRLAATGAVQVGGSKAKVVFDDRFFAGTLIPAAGVTTTYQVVSATGGLNGTFGTVTFVTVDPTTHIETPRTIDQVNGTRFMGGFFDVVYGTNDFALTITGFPGPDPLGPGTTSTNVVVDVPYGTGTVQRSANIGTVQNSQINASVVAMNALITAPGAPADVQYVGTQLLLNPAGPYASATFAVSSLANPYAMPNATMGQLFQAGDVAMKRLMQLRNGLLPADGQAAGGSQASAGQASQQGGMRVSRPFGAELNGATPDIASRVWTRGFGYTANVTNDTWADSKYSVVSGGAMLGADTYVGNGAILGGFVGYAPGSVDVTTGLVDESNNLNGVDFGVYGSWVPGKGRWYVEGSAVGQFGMVDRSRTLYVPGVVRVANSSNNQWGLSAGGETGLNMWLGGDTYLQPYVRAFFGMFNREGYTESGAGSADLTVGNQQAYAIQPGAGARFMHGMRMSGSVLTPYVGGGFAAMVPIGDWSTTATNAFSGLPGFTVTGDPETRYGGSLEAGLEWAMPSGLTAYASFNGLFMTDAQQYGGQIGLNIPF